MRCNNCINSRIEFKNLDLGRLRNIISNPIINDGRNNYDPDKMKSYGFIYRGVGRGYLNGDVK